MLQLYIAITVIVGLLHVYDQSQTGNDIGDNPIHGFTALQELLSEPTLTSFGAVTLWALYSLWILCVWPWMVLGFVFIRIPKYLYSLMYKKL